MEMSTTRAR